MALIRAIDTSSAQAKDLAHLIEHYVPDHCVVKLYQRVEGKFRDWTIQQAKSAKAAGKTVGGYVWLYRDVDPVQQVGDALEIAAKAGIDLPILWLDLETYTDGSWPTLAQVGQAVNEAVRLGAKVGLYTGGWFWRGYYGNPGDFSDLPLWTADYNKVPDLESAGLYGGWTRERVKGHQYDAREIDLDVFDPSVAGARDTPPPSYSVGPGILAAMQDQGDAPASDELFGKSSYADGQSGKRYTYYQDLNRTLVVTP